MKKSCIRIVAGIVAVFGAAVGASAQEATPDTWLSETTSTRNRAEVRAEGLAQQAAERQSPYRIEDTFASNVPATRTRDEVAAELAQARASGEYEYINAEASLFVPALQRTRHAQLQQ